MLTIHTEARLFAAQLNWTDAVSKCREAIPKVSKLEDELAEMDLMEVIPMEDWLLVCDLGWVYGTCAAAANSAASGNLADAIDKYKRAIGGPANYYSRSKSVSPDEFARRLTDPDSAPVIVALSSTLYRDAMQKLYQGDRQGAIQTVTELEKLNPKLALSLRNTIEEGDKQPERK
jgi:hypothetical protein